MNTLNIRIGSQIQFNNMTGVVEEITKVYNSSIMIYKTRIDSIYWDQITTATAFVYDTQIESVLYY